MATQDTCCTIVPYFKAHDGKLSDVKKMCEQLVERTSSEPKCLFYGFSFDGDQFHCREGYSDAEGALAHLDNVGDLLKQIFEISDLTRLEVHGPAQEIEKLKGPMADMSPQFFTLEYGFRR